MRMWPLCGTFKANAPQPVSELKQPAKDDGAEYSTAAPRKEDLTEYAERMLREIADGNDNELSDTIGALPWSERWPDNLEQAYWARMTPKALGTIYCVTIPLTVCLGIVTPFCYGGWHEARKAQPGSFSTVLTSVLCGASLIIPAKQYLDAASLIKFIRYTIRCLIAMNTSSYVYSAIMDPPELISPELLCRVFFHCCLILLAPQMMCFFGLQMYERATHLALR